MKVVKHSNEKIRLNPTNVNLLCQVCQCLQFGIHSTLGRVVNALLVHASLLLTFHEICENLLAL